MVKRERMNVESSKIPEEDDALPLLMSMAQIQTKAALDASRLPTISSILPSLPTSFGSSTPTHFSQMAPSTPPLDRTSSSSPVPQSSPPSPSTLSPGLFGSYSLISTSSASSTSFGHAGASSATPMPSTATSSHHHHQQQAYVSATNSLMELSDIISSSTQKLPVPIYSVKPERSDDSESDNVADVDNGEYVDSDGLATDLGSDSPVSSRTRRVTRSQQKQIDRLQSEIELERERARELEQTLQLALRERSELLAGRQQQQLSGSSFVNVLSAASADRSPQLALVNLPRTHSAPPAATSSESSAEAEPRPLSVGRSSSAPMLPPIASIPGLSPYLSRKRGSLPSPLGAAASPLRPGSPSTSPLRPPVSAESAYAGARGASSRRRKSVDRDDTDEDYDPASSAAAKKIKRTRSMSEAAGRRLPGVGSTRRRRSESHYQAGSRSAYGGDDDHDHGHVAAAFMAMRAKAIEERYARESRLMDVVEGADQEGDNDDGDDYAEYRQQQQEEQEQKQQQPSRVATRRDSVLDFMKDHPHASFWLKARN
jgi:hypothetical protein